VPPLKGNLDEARSAFVRALSIFRTKLGDAHGHTQLALNALKDSDERQQVGEREGCAVVIFGVLVDISAPQRVDHLWSRPPSSTTHEHGSHEKLCKPSLTTTKMLSNCSLSLVWPGWKAPQYLIVFNTPRLLVDLAASLSKYAPVS